MNDPLAYTFVTDVYESRDESFTFRASISWIAGTLPSLSDCPREVGTTPVSGTGVPPVDHAQDVRATIKLTRYLIAAY